MAFDAYIEAIGKNLSPGNATEHTHRAALGTLLESLEAGLTATNEPKRMTATSWGAAQVRGDAKREAEPTTALRSAL